MEEKKDFFKVKFYGVRGSYPTPSKDFLEYGGNTSCIEININNKIIILDAGTGIINLGENIMTEYISSGTNTFNRKPINITLLISHVHLDHIQGFPFFKPAHVKTSNLNIYGFSEYKNGLNETFSNILFGKSFPLDLGDIAGNINISDITENQIIILKEDSEKPIIKNINQENDIIPQDNDIVITCLKTYSHPKNGNNIFKIAYKDKSVVYASDIEGYIGGDKKLSTFARNTDLLIHDAQYTTEDYLNTASTKQGYGHSTFDMAIEMQKLSHAKKLAFFHLDPTYDDNIVKQIENHYKKNKNCFVAKEGLEISILWKNF